MMASSSGLKEFLDKIADSRAFGKENSSSEMSVYKSSDQVSIRSPISEKSSIQKFEYSRDPCSTVEDEAKAAGNKSSKEPIRSKTSKESSVYKFKYSCDPCRTAKDEVEAAGYCTNCDEYLCCTCFKTHSRNKTSRHHLLMDKNQMPEEAIAFCNPCKTVGEKIEATGCCTDCEDYLCNDCFKCHTRNKTSRHHTVLDKVNMSQFSDRNLASSVSSMNICKVDGGKSEENKKYTFIRAINIKGKEDEKDCYITGMTVLSDKEIVLADYNNKSLKVVDTESGLIKRTLNVPFTPSGISAISSSYVAVVFYNEPCIQILSMSKYDYDTKTIDTKGHPTSIDICRSRMYVSFREQVHFQIYEYELMMHGNKLTINFEHEATITPDTVQIKIYCSLPRCIGASRDKNLLVSDWNTGNVASIDKEGKTTLLLERDPERHTLRYMHRIPCEHDSLYIVCFFEEDTVYEINPYLRLVRVILRQTDGINSPLALCYNAKKNQLYISSGSKQTKYRNLIKLFELRGT